MTAMPAFESSRTGSIRTVEISCPELASSTPAVLTGVIIAPGSFVFCPDAEQVAATIQVAHNMPKRSVFFDFITAISAPIKE
jgi:hypothetical protein